MTHCRTRCLWVEFTEISDLLESAEGVSLNVHESECAELLICWRVLLASGGSCTQSCLDIIYFASARCLRPYFLKTLYIYLLALGLGTEISI